MRARAPTSLVDSSRQTASIARCVAEELTSVGGGEESFAAAWTSSEKCAHLIDLAQFDERLTVGSGTRLAHSSASS